MMFTVAITLWRREYLLPHAIQSVLNQSYPGWEIKVYSDGWSSRSRKLVASLQPDLPISYQRVRPMRRSRGNNLRRLALEEARGSHVVILGHDCLLYPTYLETMARLIGSDPDSVPVVPIDYWKEFTRRRPLPVSADMMSLGEGEVDLLCYSFPKQLALAADCFGDGMVHKRHADFLSFDALRRRKRPLFAEGPARAAHF